MLTSLSLSVLSLPDLLFFKQQMNHWQKAIDVQCKIKDTIWADWGTAFVRVEAKFKRRAIEVNAVEIMNSNEFFSRISERANGNCSPVGYCDCCKNVCVFCDRMCVCVSECVSAWMYILWHKHKMHISLPISSISTHMNICQGWT